MRTLDAAIASLRLRHAVPILLAIAGLISVYLVSVANGTTWKAVWIGVASTMFASGLVDASVQIEATRRERAVLRIAGERVARINQNVLLLISSAFDLQVDVSEMHATLAELTDHKIDLSAVAPRVFPEQTKLQGVMVHLAEIDQSLEFAVTLGSLTYAAARLGRLVAAGWLVGAGAPDVCQLGYVGGSVDVRVLFVGVLAYPGNDDFVVFGEHDVHSPVGVEAKSADVGV